MIAGILAFGARSYFEPTSQFETYIQGDVTGLAVGSAVELRGVRVGKVTRIDFSWTEYEPTQPSYIVVEFEMRNDIAPGSPGAARNELLQSAIKQGLRARVKAKGITGTSVLSLEYVNPTKTRRCRCLGPRNTLIFRPLPVNSASCSLRWKKRCTTSRASISTP